MELIKLLAADQIQGRASMWVALAPIKSELLLPLYFHLTCQLESIAGGVAGLRDELAVHLAYQHFCLKI